MILGDRSYSTSLSRRDQASKARCPSPSVLVIRGEPWQAAFQGSHHPGHVCPPDGKFLFPNLPEMFLRIEFGRIGMQAVPAGVAETGGSPCRDRCESRPMGFCHCGKPSLQRNCSGWRPQSRTVRHGVWGRREMGAAHCRRFFFFLSEIKAANTVRRSAGMRMGNRTVGWRGYKWSVFGQHCCQQCFEAG